VSSSTNGLAALLAIQPIQPILSSSSLPAPELPNINNISEQSTNPLLSGTDSSLLSIPSIAPPYPPGETDANTVNSGGVLNTLGQAATSAGLSSTGAVGAALGAMSGGSGTLFGLSIGRVAAFILGLIFIAGGIYLFGRQPISEVVSTTTKAAVAV
jgi:hypothetical protein